MSNEQSKIKVFVVWDPLLENIVSAHKTEKGAQDRCKKGNKERNKKQKYNSYYDFTYGEFELED